jgi:tRNA(Ile2) C34 agmatinyltransferase TiaS
MNPLKLITDLINEHGSASILRDRLELVKDEFKLLFDKNAALNEELANLKQSYANALSDLEAYRVAEKYTEKRGSLFRVKPDGLYSEIVYCPKCRSPMSPALNGKFRCKTCGINSNFGVHELPAILNELNKP